MRILFHHAEMPFKWIGTSFPGGQVADIEHRYRYVEPSRVLPVESGQRLQLVADASGPPCFFDGILNDPAVSARGLRAVSDIVGSRFYVPPAMRARILRAADPVATVARDMLRFEGFSACCSAYIRLDIDSEGFTARAATPGTVNVDFRDEMRGELAKVRAQSHLALTISSDTIVVARDEISVTERVVPLPLRWIKGFAEVQSHQAGMSHALRLDRVTARRFFRDLPRAASDHPQWLVPSGASVRLSARERPHGLSIRGTQRLRALEPLTHDAEYLDVYFNQSTESSAWVLGYAGQRVTLVLNAEPWRGFSGDGQLLLDLAEGSDQAVARLKAQMHWQSRVDKDALAADCGLTQGQTQKALAQLASSGALGFDLSTGAYFHRLLPFAIENIEARNPRLESARKLSDAGAVELLPACGADVRSGDVVHRVRVSSGQLTCTCPWFARHQGQRGPCKHILAAKIHAECCND